MRVRSVPAIRSFGLLLGALLGVAGRPALHAAPGGEAARPAPAPAVCVIADCARDRHDPAGGLRPERLVSSDALHPGRATLPRVQHPRDLLYGPSTPVVPAVFVRAGRAAQKLLSLSGPPGVATPGADGSPLPLYCTFCTYRI